MKLLLLIILGFLIGSTVYDPTPYEGWIMIAAMIVFICVVIFGVKIMSGAKRKEENKKSLCVLSGNTPFTAYSCFRRGGLRRIK